MNRIDAYHLNKDDKIQIIRNLGPSDDIYVISVNELCKAIAKHFIDEGMIPAQGD